MTAVSIDAEIKVEIVEIGHLMNQAGLPKEFIAAAVQTAFEFEGVCDLLKMWAAEADQSERDEVIADIQEMIDDCQQDKKQRQMYVRLDDLEGIAKNIRAFKDNLRVIVDQQGGVKRLAEVSGIPQPSLSRFFNSPTMPRRVTLHKIARALKLSRVQIPTEWS